MQNHDSFSYISMICVLGIIDQWSRILYALSYNLAITEHYIARCWNAVISVVFYPSWNF